MQTKRSYQDAASRWAGVGPYYAMFPVPFADEVVQNHSRPGDLVLDPFAGRGTSVFSAATRGRRAIGIEINPVGFVYGAAKLDAAPQDEVVERLDQIAGFSSDYRDEARRLPRFFHGCYSRRVRRFLCAARDRLDWANDRRDRTLMALLLVYLHGRKGAALSNQLRQTKSMSPQYALKWWSERDLDPPDLDPLTFVKSRLPWRYAMGTPRTACGRMYLGDSIQKLSALRQQVDDGLLPKAKLLFTSPPYYAVTNYHYDQWIRLWLLGGPANALRHGNGKRGKFEARRAYQNLIRDAFASAARVMAEDATIYVRTDAREFTYKTTVGVLREVFYGKELTEIPRPLLRPSQTRLFGQGCAVLPSKGEVDLLLTPR